MVGIGLNLFVAIETFAVLPLVLFVSGMLGVFVGIVFASMEILRSFRIVLMETTAEE
jgi:hypothetical protein